MAKFFNAFKPVYKPGSVVYGHLSRSFVSKALERYFSKTTKQKHLNGSFVNLASGGVYIAFCVTEEAVRSYRTFSSLPKRAVVFCCTFLKITFTGISPAPCFCEARTFLINGFSPFPRPYNRLKKQKYFITFT